MVVLAGVPAYGETGGEGVNEQDIDEVGPIDFIVVEFPEERAEFSGEMASELLSLVDRGAVRVLDLVLMRKHADGSVEAFELDDLGDGDVGRLRELESGMAHVLSEDDVDKIAAALEPGSFGGVLVWENTWAGPFAAAVRRSGGQLVASGRIPVQAILAAVEADEEAVAKGA